MEPAAREQLTEAFALRPMRETDFGFIRNTWLEGCRQTEGRLMSNDVYYPGFHELLVRLVPGRTVMAVSHEDPDQLFGYVCAEPDRNVLHYAYVKMPFRRLGIMTAMLRALSMPKRSPVTVTFCSPMLRHFAQHVFYNPFEREPV